MRLGAGAGVVVTTLKVLALAAICVLAIAVPGGAIENFAPVAREKSFFAAIAPVMTAILWTFDGWSDVGAVAGEVKAPQRTLPKVYLIGTLAAVGLYVAINAAYMYVLPVNAIAASNSVAGDLMTTLLGPVGGVILTVMVLTSTLGSTHASIITGARVTFAQAQDGLLFRFLGRVHTRHQTPHVALWMQCTLSCIAVLFLRDFSSLAGGFVFTIWIFYGLAALAVVVLRIRRPDLPRTYRTPGYPIIPALFILSALTMTSLSIIDSPKQTLPWLGVLVAGFPIYFFWERLRVRA
jgi:amino acid transporter